MLTRTKVLDLMIAALLVLTLVPGPATAGAPVRGPALAAAPTTRTVEHVPSATPLPAGEVPGVRATAAAENVEFVGHIGGATWAVAVQGDYAYIGEGPRLTILDISNPASPTVVGKTDPLHGIVRGVAVAGGYAYVVRNTGYSYNDGSLQVVDVSDPANPAEAGFYDTPGSAQGVAVAGGYAYVADGSGGLRVVDVSDPANPTEVGCYDTPGYARGVAVAGDYAYVADDDAGLRVVDVSDPTNPTEVGSYDMPGWASDVAMADGYAYVVGNYSGLHIVDVSNPANPTEVGFSDVIQLCGFGRVVVVGGYAYVADWCIRLRVVDVSTPSNPTEVGRYDTPGEARGVVVAGGTAYVADGSAGLRMVDVSTPSAPTEVGFYERLGNASGTAIAGDWCYVIGNYSGGPVRRDDRLRVLDVSTPSNPREVGYCNMPRHAYGMAVAGGYAYVADYYGGLRVVDVSDPTNPTEVGACDTPEYAHGVAVAEGYAYVADGYAGLRVVDVSNPANPTEVGFHDTPGEARGVAVAGGYAYVADGYYGGLRVVDISDQSNPTEVGSYDTPGYAVGVAVAGGYAYVADDDGGLRVVDVSNPANPTEVGSYDTPGGAQGVAVTGDYAYVADDDAGLRVVDISDPTNLMEVGSYDTPGSAEGVAVAGGYTYVAAGDAGLFILRYLPYAISGHIRDGGGNPISGVAVSTRAGGTATTDASGVYTITGFITGTYTLTPSKTGYTFSPASRTVSVPPDATGQDFGGYDSPPIVFVHGWNGLPPWGLCEWPEPDPYFESVDEYLENAGYYVGYARLETSPCYTPPLVENVTRLQHAIALAKAATGQDKVILIAHSMGGLVSRAYIEGPEYTGDVKALFTFGSPHQGVPEAELALFANGLSLGVYCRDWQPAACDLSVDGMELFNRNHPERAAGVTYHVIGGAAPFSPRRAFAKVMYFLLPGGDDGLVQTGSGIGLGGLVDRWTTDEVHSAGSGPRSYFIRDDGPSTSYMQCLKPVLVDKTTSTCGSFGLLQATGATTPTLAERTPFEYGTLLAGQTNTHTSSLPGGSTLFAAHYQTGTLAVTLVDPNDQVINPAYAASHPDIVTYTADGTVATYDFPDAIAGDWDVVLAATDVPTDGSDYTTFTVFDSTLKLTAETDHNWYTSGATATITAALSDSPVSAMITATILYADGVSETLSLSSQGAGQYQGAFVVPDAPGYGEVRLVATGSTATSVPFERGLNLVFQVAPDSVALTGAYSDTPLLRAPGSAFYEALSVTVGINSVVSGTVGLSAELVDADDNFVAHSFTLEDVITGTGVLALRFDGDEIYASGRNGPYTLTNLLLTDQRGPTLAVLEAEDVYTTATYNYRSFGTGNIYLPLVLRNH